MLRKQARGAKLAGEYCQLDAPHVSDCGPRKKATCRAWPSETGRGFKQHAIILRRHHRGLCDSTPDQCQAIKLAIGCHTPISSPEILLRAVILQVMPLLDDGRAMLREDSMTYLPMISGGNAGATVTHHRSSSPCCSVSSVATPKGLPSGATPVCLQSW